MNNTAVYVCELFCRLLVCEGVILYLVLLNLIYSFYMYMLAPAKQLAKSHALASITKLGKLKVAPIYGVGKFFPFCFRFN